MSLTFAEAKAAGLCYQCRARRPDNGLKRCDPCREKAREARRRRLQDPEYAQKVRDKASQWCKDNPERARANRKAHRDRLREAARAAYGAACACCGEAESQFLTIDHVNGDGAEHRRSLGLKGTDFYRWLKLNNYPSEFQLLCWNCNCAKGLYGACPHEAQRAA